MRLTAAITSLLLMSSPAFCQDLSTPGGASILVEFLSDPSGAEVYVSDTFVGRTPVTVRVNASTDTRYRIVAPADDFEDFEGILNFSRDETISIYLTRRGAVQETGDEPLPAASPPTPEPTPTVGYDETLSPSERITPFLEEYFEKVINRGESGLDMWCGGPDNVMASTFFTPTAWALLRTEVGQVGRIPDAHVATVRVNSSNRGGMPIVNNWLFYLNPEEDSFCLDTLAQQR